MLQFPTKALKKDEPEEKQLPQTAKAEEQEAVAPQPVSIQNLTELRDEFASGKILGEELKKWVEEKQETGLFPSVEELVLKLLTEKEEKGEEVDQECAWAEPSQFGSALTMLVEDNLTAQMEVLWAIQKFCHRINFPKKNNEYVVQAMFRSMYKYDLADDEAFAEWKEDESDANEVGKMKAIIQTVEWFNWLEEDEEEDDEEDYEENKY